MEGKCFLLFLHVSNFVRFHTDGMFNDLSDGSYALAVAKQIEVDNKTPLVFKYSFFFNDGTTMHHQVVLLAQRVVLMIIQYLIV